MGRNQDIHPGTVQGYLKSVTGHSPFEHIRARRLAGAAAALRERDEKVMDIALGFMFDTNEGFTRAFSRKFGIAPGAFRKISQKEGLFMKRSCIERPAGKLILKRGIKAADYFEYCSEVGCEI